MPLSTAATTEYYQGSAAGEPKSMMAPGETLESPSRNVQITDVGTGTFSYLGMSSRATTDNIPRGAYRDLLASCLGLDKVHICTGIVRS